MQINWLAVVLAGLAAHVVGFIWYSPCMFGGLWKKLSRVEPYKQRNKKEKRQMYEVITVSLLTSLIIAFVLELLFDMYLIRSMASGLIFASWSWLGLVATFTAYPVLYEKRSFKLYVLNNVHYLISLLVTAAFLIGINKMSIMLMP